MNSIESIHASIPHRAPMLLVDEVVDRTDQHIHCLKTFNADEFFFRGHYPQSPLVPGVILCEAAMQAGAILLSKHLDNGDNVPVATRMNNVKFKKMIRPGDTIEITVELIERMADAFFLRGNVSCDGSLAVRLEFACTLAPPPLENANDGDRGSTVG